MESFSTAIIHQYGSALDMFKQCIELCPEDLWLAGEHPRNTWRIAYHACFYTDMYLHQRLADFTPWEHHIKGVTDLWGKPKVVPAYAKKDVLGYLNAIIAKVPECVQSLDLSAKTSGFSWYPKMTKLEHQLVNLRHLAGHVGQLSELLEARGIHLEWRN